MTIGRLALSELESERQLVVALSAGADERLHRIVGEVGSVQHLARALGDGKMVDRTQRMLDVLGRLELRPEVSGVRLDRWLRMAIAAHRGYLARFHGEDLEA